MRLNSPKTENRKPKTVLFSDPLLDSLNQAQRQAVTYTGPALVVAAGPGTGKTRALTHRLAYLLARRGVPPGGDPGRHLHPAGGRRNGRAP